MKNWKLFLWAIDHLDVDGEHIKRNWKNNFLLWLKDISGVTYMDMFKMYYDIGDELKRRDSA